MYMGHSNVLTLASTYLFAVLPHMPAERAPPRVQCRALLTLTQAQQCAMHADRSSLTTLASMLDAAAVPVTGDVAEPGIIMTACTR